MEVKFKNAHLESGRRHPLSDQKIEETLLHFDDFKTWGFLGDPTDDHPINSFYIVPRKPIIMPKKNKKIEELGIDYKELSGVISTDKQSFFCSEYFYSYDEFSKTKHHGTFKIEICPENKLILEWIVRKRSVLLINDLPKTSMMVDLNSLLFYFSKNPSFLLPIKDVSGLVFNDHYLELL
jgi:hypothetical protein